MVEVKSDTFKVRIPRLNLTTFYVMLCRLRINVDISWRNNEDARTDYSSQKPVVPFIVARVSHVGLLCRTLCS